MPYGDREAGLLGHGAGRGFEQVVADFAVRLVLMMVIQTPW